ncbi:MAG: ShlB/FhaC/HecB family hemolysin secretion/activation protein [Gammaproteobacteria bacterium]
MAVALPPPVAPAPVPVAEIRRHAAAVRYPFGTHTLNLHGFDALDRDVLDRLVRYARSADEVVLALAHLAQASEGLAAQVVYAVDGRHVYIMVVQRRVRGVRGDPELRRFFAAALDDGRVERDSFERSRVLASAYSERACVIVQPRFVDAPGGALDLDLRADAEPGSRFTTSVELNNHGSRFAGRNLVALDLTGNSAGGTQGRLQVRTAPSALNDAEAGGEFLEGDVQLNTVGPGGVAGLTARRVDFSADTGRFVLGGWYQEYGLEWSNVLSAEAASRFMLRLRGAYSDRESERESDGRSLFAERYALAELTPSYAASLGFGRFDAAVSVIGGWASEQYNSSAAERFQVVRPMLRLRWEQSGGAALTLTAAGQWASETVAEAQQWTLGGHGSLSGYAPATLVGDRGMLLRIGEGAEWRLRNGWSLNGEAFAEHGRAESVGKASAEPVDATHAGVGAGVSWRRTLRLAVSAARPLDGPELADDALADFYGTLRFSF